jgi:hypothetical protein
MHFCGYRRLRAGIAASMKSLGVSEAEGVVNSPVPVALWKRQRRVVSPALPARSNVVSVCSTTVLPEIETASAEVESLPKASQLLVARPRPSSFVLVKAEPPEGFDLTALPAASNHASSCRVLSPVSVDESTAYRLVRYALPRSSYSVSLLATSLPPDDVLRLRYSTARSNLS